MYWPCLRAGHSDRRPARRHGHYMAIAFTKVEAIGNHFVLIDARDLPEMDWSALALEMCAHHFGVGSDGLLVMSRSESADFRFRMWNPDGTEDVCGNGMRCGAVFVFERGLVGKRSISFEAMSGIVSAEVVVNEEDACCASVNMGTPSTRADDIPVAVPAEDGLSVQVNVDGGMYTANCVLVGTPHAVIFADVSDFWETIPPVSAEIEKHPLFPERINVTWCHVESPESLLIRTWERGVGPTLGCGSGACAALVAANLHGLAGTSASVRSPGGVLRVEWPEHRDITASGPARIVFEGEWPD